jgi:serine/threonine-protein kinase
LLKAPHEPIFTIKEAIKVADQLSQALAHCHKVEVRHGDIKSNNVKLNIHSGNYVLLDFGLAIMSDEQRRTSLRHAGAIEFMAPEQNEGQMLFPTDVYSFGVILFELLAGTVPFPLHDKGETARNRVMVSHMETPPPDLLELRKQHLPADWSDEKKEREMNVPAWLLSLVYKCLEKKPANRFENGIELHDYIVLNSTLSANKIELTGNDLIILQKENEKLLKEKSQLQNKIAQYQQAANKKDEELALLTEIVTRKDAELNEIRATSGSYTGEGATSKSGVSKGAFYVLLILTICLGVFAAYSFFSKNSRNDGNMVSGVDSTLPSDLSNMNSSDDDGTVKTSKMTEEESNQHLNSEKGADSAGIAAKEVSNTITENPVEETHKSLPETNDSSTSTNSSQTNDSNGNAKKPEEDNKTYYTVISRAYFYDKPEEDTKRDAYIVHWNNARLVPLDEANGYIYIVYKNNLGQTSKGWLRKSDLKLVSP